MSSIGKIFVVLNLVLSVLVVGAAGALLHATDSTKADVEKARAEVVTVKAAAEENGSHCHAGTSACLRKLPNT